LLAATQYEGKHMFKTIKYFVSAVFSTNSNAKFPPHPPKKNVFVMQLVVAATNQNALYTFRLRANKDIFSVYNSRYRFALIVCQ
jgi:hypothetical protein